MNPHLRKDRRLLATMTKEPFQPVRLYYSIPSPTFVAEKLRPMKCMIEVPPERCWQWLFASEAASIRFPACGYRDVPKEKRPIILGRIRFPKPASMTLEANSIERAIAGARFFASRLGQEIVATRVRVVNRFFTADEGQPNMLMGMLDQDVTVVATPEAEAALLHHFRDVRRQDFRHRTADTCEPERAVRSGTTYANAGGVARGPRSVAGRGGDRRSVTGSD